MMEMVRKDGLQWMVVEGIRITDIDTSGIFDSDDMTIKGRLSAALLHTNNASLEAFSLCIK